MKNELTFDAASSHTSNNKAAAKPLDADLQKHLLTKYHPLVRSVVNRMRTRLPQNADLEELHSVGVGGLIAAVRRYDKLQAATFPAYAVTRIRGAILDELRKMDTLPRTRRAKVREINQAVEELEQKLGRAPRDEELAEKLGITTPELYKLQESTRPSVTISLDSPQEDSSGNETSLHDAIADEGHISCQERMERAELVQILGQHINTLPERQRLVVSMYYFESMRLTDIAKIFGVTEARICQIHTQAVASLRRGLTHAQAA